MYWLQRLSEHTSKKGREYGTVDHIKQLDNILFLFYFTIWYLSTLNFYCMLNYFLYLLNSGSTTFPIPFFTRVPGKKGVHREGLRILFRMQGGWCLGMQFWWDAHYFPVRVAYCDSTVCTNMAHAEQQLSFWELGIWVPVQQSMPMQKCTKTPAFGLQGPPWQKSISTLVVPSCWGIDMWAWIERTLKALPNFF